MKKIYTLALCLSFSTLAFSQQKSEFGFVVKVGNHALPSTRFENDSYSTNASINTTTFKAGEVYTIGIWQSFPLNNHFRLSGELLGRFSSFTNRKKEATFYTGGSFHNQETEKNHEISVSLPIKLQYFFKKDGKTSVAIGAGFSRLFSSNVYLQSRAESSPLSEFSGTYTSTYSIKDAGSNQLSLSAGFYYRLDAKTSLGFEYTFERATKSYHPNTFFPLNPSIDFLYYLPKPRLIPNMNSFSVSLRHNILD